MNLVSGASPLWSPRALLQAWFLRVCVSASLSMGQDCRTCSGVCGPRLTQAVSTITICPYKYQNPVLFKKLEPQIHVFSYTYVYSLSKCSFILVCVEVYGKMLKCMKCMNKTIRLCVHFICMYNCHLAQILLSRFCCCCPLSFTLWCFTLSYENMKWLSTVSVTVH